MADKRTTETQRQSHADVGKRRGGVRTLIIVAVIVALIVIAFAVFGRRSGEGQKEQAIGSATVIADQRVLA